MAQRKTGTTHGVAADGMADERRNPRTTLPDGTPTPQLAKFLAATARLDSHPASKFVSKANSKWSLREDIKLIIATSIWRCWDAVFEAVWPNATPEERTLDRDATRKRGTLLVQATMLMGVGPTQDVRDLGTDMIAWFDADDDMPFEDFMLQPIEVRHKGLDDAYFRHMVTNTLASHLYPSTTVNDTTPSAPSAQAAAATQDHRGEVSQAHKKRSGASKKKHKKQ